MSLTTGPLVLPYAGIVSLNVRMARAAVRPKLSQAALAERMRALGFNWFPQTVGSTETGSRIPKIDEVVGLAVALETDVTAIIYPPGRFPWQPVSLRNGFELVLPPARAWYQPDAPSIWDGTKLTVQQLRVSPSSGPAPGQ